MCLVTNTCKISFMVDLRTLKYLNKYFFRKKVQLYFREKDFENIYVKKY
jgi:hypothetical protein